MLQNLLPGIDDMQIDRALVGIQLCKDYERNLQTFRVFSKNMKVCRFLGSILIMTTSTFGVNLEWPHGAGSPLPCWVPSPIRCRSYPGKSNRHSTLCTKVLQPLGIIALWSLCFVNSPFQGGPCLLVTGRRKAPGPHSCYSQIQFDLALLFPWDFYFTKSFSKSFYLHVSDRMFSSIFRWLGNRGNQLAATKTLGFFFVLIVIFHYVITEWNLWFNRKPEAPVLNIMTVLNILKCILWHSILLHYGIYFFLETKHRKA